MTLDSNIKITEIGPQNFSMAVVFAGREFVCGSYISRAAAMQAGKLFVERKRNEETGHRKSPRKK